MAQQNVYQVKDDDFIEAVTNSSNISQALKKMNLAPRGGNYPSLKNRCLKLGITPPTTKPQRTGDKLIRKNTTEESIKLGCANNFSRAGLLRSVGLISTGANVRWVEKQLTQLKINTDHWTGSAHLRNKTHNWGVKTSLDNILVKNSSYTSSHRLKNRLISEKGWLEKCSICLLTEWCEGKISFHLDHINGISDDNRLENLRLLCPNCHSQTPTYCGRNKGKEL